jgi:outer membrane protein TolC
MGPRSQAVVITVFGLRAAVGFCLLAGCSAVEFARDPFPIATQVAPAPNGAPADKDATKLDTGFARDGSPVASASAANSSPVPHSTSHISQVAASFATSDSSGPVESLSLPQAIAIGLAKNPRLRSARAAIQRAHGEEVVAFSPFLPQIDLLHQSGVVSSTLAPGIPGSEGFLIANGFGTRSYTQTEVGLEWTLYDFGRTCGRYCQAAARERITELQLVRANQTVEFDVANAYLEVLLARASRRVQTDAVRRAQAILGDTAARRKEGVALKDDVLRAEVQLSESRAALVVAQQGEYDAVSRLNNTMGQNAEVPLQVVDLERGTDLKSALPLPEALDHLLEVAATQRPEVGVARQGVAAAESGREAARGEFLPRIFVRAVAGHTDGENVITGWQEGAGLHVEAPLYAGGKHRGQLREADAEIESAFADAQTILDDVSLQVNLAYRGVVSAEEQVSLARPAVEQSAEALRIVGQRYRAGTATPTDIIDSETTATRSDERYVSARILYLSALARLAYVLGDDQEALCLRLSSPDDNSPVPAAPPAELPRPRAIPPGPLP